MFNYSQCLTSSRNRDAITAKLESFTSLPPAIMEGRYMFFKFCESTSIFIIERIRKLTSSFITSDLRGYFQLGYSPFLSLLNEFHTKRSYCPSGGYVSTVEYPITWVIQRHTPQFMGLLPKISDLMIRRSCVIATTQTTVLYET